MNKTTIFRTDMILMTTFPLTIASGLAIHAAGHGCNPHSAKLWIGIHLLTSLLFLAFSAAHIKAHWSWYKGLVKGIGRRSRLTLWLSVAYLLTAITGITLMLLKGNSHHLGILHMLTGLLATCLGLWHIFSRIKVLIRMKK